MTNKQRAEELVDKYVFYFGDTSKSVVSEAVAKLLDEAFEAGRASVLAKMPSSEELEKWADEKAHGHIRNHPKLAVTIIGDLIKLSLIDGANYMRDRMKGTKLTTGDNNSSKVCPKCSKPLERDCLSIPYCECVPAERSSSEGEE